MLKHEQGQSATFKTTERSQHLKAYLKQDLRVPSGMAYKPKAELFKAQVSNQITFAPAF